ncbi:MAG: homoserine dehydrogenase [Candidatus Caenarcaniphilales bacterium]|nr:homoserine dehydrogenase [Candidatus Caenarcaniphilales bacterium]
MVVNIGILGCGTVGSGLVELLKNYPEIAIKKVAVRDTSKDRGLALAKDIFTDKPEDVIDNPEVDIVIELMGGVERTQTLISKALENGKHVISANKDLIALKGEELFAVADKNKKTILYEAAVAGGIPVIATLKQSLQGNHIKELYGIINGTTNYILDQMKKHGASFEDALQEAQNLGYAEADPTNDVDAHDAAYKISILASIISGKKVDVNKVFREGLRKITQTDIQSAEKRGYTIKLLAIAKNESDELDVRVHPVFVPKETTLANISAENNAVMVNGSAVGELTLIGKGAGSLATASSVLGDLLMLVNQSNGINPQFAVAAHTKEAQIKNIADVKNSFYLRLAMHDKIGVLKNLGDITEKNGANVKFIDQYAVEGDQALADLLLDPLSEADMNKMIEDIEALPSIKAIESVIRVLDFN